MLYTYRTFSSFISDEFSSGVDIGRGGSPNHQQIDMS